MGTKPNLELLQNLTKQAWEMLHERLLPSLDGNGWIDTDLMGACAIGAALLRVLLHEAGISSKLVLGAQYSGDVDHVFVRVGDWYLDPTYEQFEGGKPWLVTNVSEYPLVKEGMLVREGRLPRDWPEEQHPKTFMGKILGYEVNSAE